jgi:hypothetical protein
MLYLYEDTRLEEDRLSVHHMTPICTMLMLMRSYTKNVLDCIEPCWADVSTLHPCYRHAKLASFHVRVLIRRGGPRSIRHEELSGSGLWVSVLI